MKVPSFLEFLTESKLQLFHISAGKLKYDKLVPRVPKTVDSNNDENTTIKRVCFGKSINDCISAVPYGGENLDLIRRVWHVYSPINIDIKYLYQPTEKDVPDIKRTNEIWYLKECDIKYLGMIFVTGAKNTSKVFKDAKNNVEWHKTHKYYEFLKSNYEPPYSIQELFEVFNDSFKIEQLCGKHFWTLKDNSGDTVGQIAHKWRAITGVEFIHPEPDLEEQKRIWSNWNLMNSNMKALSDAKCQELYNCTNAEHHINIMRNKWGLN
jgi:hypothetical protein